jgi:hypothetical protein
MTNRRYQQQGNCVPLLFMWANLRIQNNTKIVVKSEIKMVSNFCNLNTQQKIIKYK